MELEPKWLFETIRSSLVVRMDLVASQYGGYIEMHAVIIGSHEDDDGSDPFVLELRIDRTHDLQLCSFNWKWLIRGRDNYINFVRAPLIRWPEAWLVEKPNYARVGTKERHYHPDATWTDLRMSDSLALLALARIQGIVDNYQPTEDEIKRNGTHKNALDALQSRLAGLINTEYRHFQNYLDQIQQR